MILYLDTSSLVKLYVEEKDSSKIADLVIASEISATSLIAYAESRKKGRGQADKRLHL